VPENAESKLDQMNSWDGVFGSLQRLEDNVMTYLIDPLLDKAVNEIGNQFSSDEENLTWSLGSNKEWIAYGALVILVLSITAIVHKKKYK